MESGARDRGVFRPDGLCDGDKYVMYLIEQVVIAQLPHQEVGEILSQRVEFLEPGWLPMPNAFNKFGKPLGLILGRGTNGCSSGVLWKTNLFQTMTIVTAARIRNSVESVF